MEYGNARLLVKLKYCILRYVLVIDSKDNLNRKYEDYVYRKMLVQEYLKK